MKRRIKLISVFSALFVALCASHARAASFAETNSFGAATRLFGLNFWDQAEKAFADFTRKYTNSDLYASAVVLQGQSLFQLQRYTDVVYLLSKEQERAGTNGDQFAYWIGKAQLAGTNYAGATNTFARLLNDYPGSEWRLDAAVSEAEALYRLESWDRVRDVLQSPAGAFQQIASSSPTNEHVVRGLLMLSQAEMAQHDWPAAETTLRDLGKRALSPEIEWKRQYALGHVQLSAGHLDEALQTSASLPALGRTNHNAETGMFHAEALDRAGQVAEAILAYQQSAGAELSPPLRRQALQRIVELHLQQNEVAAAAASLQDFLTLHPDEASSDVLLLSGEVKLKQFYLRPDSSAVPAETLTAEGRTNLLLQAVTNFEKVVATPTNGLLAGKAHLNLGWCYLTEGRPTESEAAFSNAVSRLPFSDDQAVARFKLADAQYQRADYAGAFTNYKLVIGQYRSIPMITNELVEPALYQIVRVALAQTNITAANEAMTNLKTWYPNGPLLGPAKLLAGQAFWLEGEAARARDVLVDFATASPDSSLLPEVKLAIARTYEAGSDWTNAISQYETWLSVYTNHPARSRAEFALASAYSAAGNESNAYNLFTNFVTTYQTDKLAPLAQYWVADYFWRQKDYYNAESAYSEVFKNTNWLASELRDEAQMAAGRAAMARDPKAATNYFLTLGSQTNLSERLWIQASFALSDSLMNMSRSRYVDALHTLGNITNRFPTNAAAALAAGRMGDCLFQLAGLDPTNYQYSAALTNYQMVTESPLADISARSEAEFMMGRTLEKMSELEKTAPARTNLLDDALRHYLKVVEGTNLAPGEKVDLFWVKEAGMAAGKLAETLGRWESAMKLNQELADLLKSMKAACEARILKAQEKLRAEKNADKQ